MRIHDVEYHPHTYDPVVFSSDKPQRLPYKAPIKISIYLSIVTNTTSFQKYPLRLKSIVQQVSQPTMKSVDCHASRDKYSHLLHCKSITWFSIDSIFGAIGPDFSSWSSSAIEVIATESTPCNYSLHETLYPGDIMYLIPFLDIIQHIISHFTLLTHKRLRCVSVPISAINVTPEKHVSLSIISNHRWSGLHLPHCYTSIYFEWSVVVCSNY